MVQDLLHEEYEVGLQNPYLKCLGGRQSAIVLHRACGYDYDQILVVCVVAGLG